MATDIFLYDPTRDAGAVTLDDTTQQLISDLTGSAAITEGNDSSSGTSVVNNRGSVAYNPNPTVTDSQVDNFAQFPQGFSNTVRVVGQAVFGSGREAVSLTMKLTRVGNPTGAIKAVIYAASGTPGSGAVGTGSILAESGTIDVSTIATSATDYTFNFSTQLLLNGGSNYVVGLEYVGGSQDGTNLISPSGTTTATSHAGNATRFDTGLGWDPLAGDYYFQLTTTQSGGHDTSNISAQVQVVGVAGGPFTVYSESSGATSTTLQTGGKQGEAIVGDGRVLLSAAFAILRNTSSGSTIVAELYAATGTPGSNAVPTGSALAQSTNSYTSAEIPTTLGSGVVFNFDPIQLAQGTPYAVVVSVSGGSGSLSTRYNSSSVDPNANRVIFSAGAWSSSSTQDQRMSITTQYLPEENDQSSASAVVDNRGSAAVTEGEDSPGGQLSVFESYAFSNIDSDFSFGEARQVGQTFTAPANIVLKAARFHLKKTSGIGQLNARIYAVSGGLPDGAALAASGAVSLASLTSSYQAITFTFSSSVNLTNGTTYAIVVAANTDATTVQIGQDTSSPSHSGQRVFHDEVSWAGTTAADVGFELLEEAAVGTVANVGSAAITEDGDTPGSFQDSPVEGYDFANASAGLSGNAVVGQSFTPSATGYLKGMTFRLQNIGGAAGGTLVANLYAESGDLPTGAALATSSTIQASAVSSAAQHTFTFDGTYELQSGTKYIAVLDRLSSDPTFLQVFADNTSATHAGRFSSSADGSTWSLGASGVDLVFEVTASTLAPNTGEVADNTRNGTIAVTEENDSASATGTRSFQGTIAVTEAGDTTNTSGTLNNRASSAITEADDTSSSTAVITITGTFAQTETNDTISVSALVTIAGTTTTITEQDDTTNVTAVILVAGTADVTEANDTSSISGEIPGDVTGTGTVVELADASNIVALLVVAGTVTATEANDVSDGQGGIPSSVTGTVATTEAADAASSSGTIQVTGTITVTETLDTSNASGTLLDAGTSTSTEQDDVASISGTLNNRASAAITEGGDTGTASGTINNRASVVLTEANDTTSASGSVRYTGSGALQESNDTTAIAAIIRVSGTIVLSEGADLLSATGINLTPITGTITVVEANDTTQVVAEVPVQGGYTFVRRSQRRTRAKIRIRRDFDIYSALRAVVTVTSATIIAQRPTYSTLERILGAVYKSNSAKIHIRAQSPLTQPTPHLAVRVSATTLLRARVKQRAPKMHASLHVVPEFLYPTVHINAKVGGKLKQSVLRTRTLINDPVLEEVCMILAAIPLDDPPSRYAQEEETA